MFDFVVHEHNPLCFYRENVIHEAPENPWE
jgi:hypothetical protein